MGNAYGVWDEDLGYPARDTEMLKRKFEPLVNESKPTGSPSCPQSVRRAKLISRSILNRAVCCPLGIDDELDDMSEMPENKENANRESELPLGARSNSRGVIRAGSRKSCTCSDSAAKLLSTVSSVACDFKELVSNISSKKISI